MNEIELCLLYMTLMLEMNFGSIWIGNTRDQIQFNNVSQNPHSILFVSDSYKQCFVMDFLFSHEHCIVQICSFFFGGNTVFGAFLMDPISIILYMNCTSNIFVRADVLFVYHFGLLVAFFIFHIFFPEVVKDEN